jgi:protein tyrosine phosphatase (PTP) superfamily phosphohydrolase (DUF442 family)
MTLTRVRQSRPALILAFLALSAVAAAAADPAGIPRFQKVSDTLYRGAQPSDQSYPELAKLGVKTVLDLRKPDEHSTSGEAKLVEAAGMHYVNVPMTGWETPTPAQIAQVSAVMDTGGVVFVHCKQGRDRTGTVTAIYRIEHEGWANDRAYAEARDKGLRWYFSGLNNTIKNYKADPVIAAKYASLATKHASSTTPAVVLTATPDSTAATAAAASQQQ